MAEYYSNYTDIIMREDIENTLKKYLKRNWSKDNKPPFLDGVKYTLDFKAVNKNLKEPIKDIVLRGGKRLRPVLFLTTLDMFGKKWKKYLDYAILIELVHNGTLVLDDIEDDGMVRRGKPASHIKYGLDTATNAGFSLHVFPLKILVDSEKKISNEQLIRLYGIYSEEMINVAFGQGLDIYWHKHPEEKVSEKKYFEMVRLKTGSLMRMSLRMACVLSGKNKKVEKSFKEFGENIGMAFQIIDDSLDLRREDIKFGKIYGNDISEGKLSLPVVYAFKSLSKKDSNRLREILGKHTKDKGAIREAVDLIEKKGSVKRAVKKAKNIINKAWDKLEKNMNGDYDLSNLRKITLFFVERKY